jgi:hypothetical protein
MGIETSFVLSSYRFDINLSGSEILLHFRGSSQVVADDVINIGQIKRGILLDDFLGRSAIAKSPYHRV